MVKSLRIYTPKRRIIIAKPERRGSPTQRGYGERWTKTSIAFRKKHPLCGECQHQGITRPCDLVDHKIPARARPDLFWTRENWWGLCTDCHNGMKMRMERYAESRGLVDKLMMWCDDPSTRPPALEIRRSTAPKEEFLV